jgi:hypothetical protein
MAEHANESDKQEMAGNQNGDPRTGAEHHDGRFGERFDDEISARGILEVTLGIGVSCLLAIVVTWWMMDRYAAEAEANKPPPSPIVQADERRLPPGPLLQQHPERELEEMRREMTERLESYGWVDEGAGVVHLPIDRAIELIAERGTVAASGGAPAPAEDEGADPEPSGGGAE